MKEANRVLERLRESAPPIRVMGVEPDQQRLIVVTDASMGNHDDSTTQVAFIVGMGLKGEDLDGAFTLLSYHSHKLRRVAASTLMTETLAMSEGLAEAEWIQAW
eukprot:6149682-Amphidinium_carterae.1